jgi:hypothetical protein
MRTNPSLRRSLTTVSIAVLVAIATGVASPRAGAQTVTIGQTAIGNVFTQGGTPAFDVTTSATEIAWSARDYWGNRVAAGDQPVADGAVRLQVPVQNTGYYELRVTESAGGASASAQAAFAVLPEAAPPRDDGFTFGVQTHFGDSWNPQLVPLLQRIGVEAVRDSLPWPKIETEPGVYNFAAENGRYETYMAALRDSGIKPLIHFGLSNPNYDNDATPHTDAGRQAYARFVTEVMRHFGQQINEVLVYNEPNIVKFGDHGDGPADALPQNYFALLRETHRAVKALRPDVTVAGPEVTIAAQNRAIWVPWLEEFFELGGLDFIDTVSVHPYRDRCSCTPEGLAGQLAEVRTLMERHGGGDKAIWNTEQGWTNELNSEAELAGFVPRTNILAMAEGLQGAQWFNFMDHNGKLYGLIRRGDSPLGANTPKPAYVSYGVMTSQLSGLAYHSADPAPQGVFSRRFGPDSAPTRAMWAPQGARSVALMTDQPLRVTDAMGTTRTLNPVGGQVSLTLTSDPLYVRGPVERIAASDQFGIRGRNTAVSEDVPATVRLNNTTQQQRTATFTVSGQNHQVAAPAGEAADLAIGVPSGGEVGRRVMHAEVRVGGTLTGLMSAEVNVLEDVAMRVTPRVTDVAGNRGTLAVTLTNNARGTARQAGRIDWTAAGAQGGRSLDLTIGPRSTQVITVPLPSAVDFWVARPMEVTVQVAGLAALNEAGEIGFNPVVRQALTIDGDVGELADAPRLSLAEHGAVKRTEIAVPYEGPQDLSGPVWMTADAENLYVAAQVTDDSFFQDQSNVETHLGDSLQVSLAQGMPGETKDWYEYIVARTPDGTQVRRSFAPEGESTGLTDDAAAVVRDADTGLTTYEVAIPWADLDQIDPADQVFSLSMLVNDNDEGGGREGWIEWGSGIGAGKDPAKFNPMTLTAD